MRLLAELPGDPQPWLWSVTDPELAGYGHHPGEMPSRCQAMDCLIERWRAAPSPQPGLRFDADAAIGVPVVWAQGPRGTAGPRSAVRVILVPVAGRR